MNTLFFIPVFRILEYKIRPKTAINESWKLTEKRESGDKSSITKAVKKSRFIGETLRYFIFETRYRFPRKEALTTGEWSPVKNG